MITLQELEKPPIAAVLRHYGAEDLPGAGYGWRPIRCPFHSDTHPSASVNTTINGFKCHTCDVAGDSWSIIMNQEGVKFVEAVRFAKERFGYEDGNISEPVRRRRPYSPSWS